LAQTSGPYARKFCQDYLVNLAITRGIGVYFYGSSFSCDQYGRTLARASKSGSAVLVAELDQKHDRLTLFSFVKT